MAQLFKNNATAILPGAVAASDTTITLAPGEGARFPDPVDGDENSFAILTLESVTASMEIVKLTARDGDILTVVRGHEGTTPIGFAAGDRIELRMTAGGLTAFKQVTDQWELRGSPINISGERIWHATDQSTYQYFLQSYVTLNQFNLNFLRWEPPPGIDKLGYQFGVNGPQGELRALQFAAGITANAPAPATGEVALDVPGVIRVSSLNNPFGSPVMYASFDTTFAEAQGGIRVSKLRFEPDPTGDSTVSYNFVTRSPDGTKHTIVFDGEGSIQCEANLKIVSQAKDTYPTADAVAVANTPRSDNPEAGDFAFFRPEGGVTVPRTLDYIFRVRDVANATAPSPDVTQYDFRMRRNGNFSIQGTPSQPTDVITLQYLQEQAFGRTVLWNGSLDSTDPNATLSSSILGFNQIMVMARLQTFFSVSIILDVENIETLGIGVAGGVWMIGSASSTVLAGIRFVSETEFNVVDTTETAAVERVIGLWPKPLE